jgi:hypothetical protein
MLRLDPRKFPRSYCLALTTLFLQIHTGFAVQTAPAKIGGVSQADVKYRNLQRKLAQGWNTWDVNSMTTYVLLPEGLGIHVGFLNNGNDFGHQFLTGTLVGQGTVFPGPHTWDGSHTECMVRRPVASEKWR